MGASPRRHARPDRQGRRRRGPPLIMDRNARSARRSPPASTRPASPRSSSAHPWPAKPATKSPGVLRPQPGNGQMVPPARPSGSSPPSRSASRTQLTMRTFHTGGVAGLDITAGRRGSSELFEARSPRARPRSAIDGIEIPPQRHRDEGQGHEHGGLRHRNACRRAPTSSPPPAIRSRPTRSSPGSPRRRTCLRVT